MVEAGCGFEDNLKLTKPTLNYTKKNKEDYKIGRDRKRA
jgi:hypothetical protein